MWAQTFLILLGTLAIQAASVGQECGRFNEEQFKSNNIITEKEEHPWVARIEHTDIDGEERLLCTSILIDARHLLTAAHCVDSDTPITGVVFGDSDSNSARRVESITIHPDYSTGKPEKDLSIIGLLDEVKFSEFVQPVCLPSAEDPKSKAPNSDLIVAGFEGPGPPLTGHTRLDERIKMAFNRTDSNECHKLQPRFPAELICGQAERKALSGSALVEPSGTPRKFHLIGMSVVGFGSPTGFFHGFLNIRSHLDWIQQTISK
ncbi:phenoloxidase-activating factor 3 [Drosophila rhopaloa]|uniref:Peptidase S1 domain-containing protein n=1 Tax=Drosophila rhopaloa TaxID=1041015 RepID=A0ABM5HQ43_DRORH|nr:phenoloxidase-activating factor 3 [Drosophila rhopaloa]